MQDNLGMEKIHEYKAYYLHGKDFIDRFATHRFLKIFKNKYAKENNISPNDLELKFISFGHYATVFVLKNKEDYKTILVGSPHLKFGTTKKEADLLKHFNNIENSIIAPIMYYKLENKLFKRELFVTPYIYQARAISNFKDKFGIFIPEPEYRFEETTAEQTQAIKTCIIAKLVASFDDKNNLGLSDVQVISGDFIMEKGWETLSPTLQNTFDKMKIISARDTIHCTFNEYLELIKKEFTKLTSCYECNFLANHDYIINTCSEIPFTPQEIENGIKLGMEKRKSKGIDCMQK